MKRFCLAFAAVLLCGNAAAAIENCSFEFEIDKEGTAFHSLVDDAEQRGGFWRPIFEAPDDVRNMGRFVGRLDVCLMTADGQPREVRTGSGKRMRSVVTTYCTASLLPGNRLLTNEHCFYDKTLVDSGFSVVREARINFLYTSQDLTDDVKTFLVDTRELARNSSVDALVLRVLAGDANTMMGGHIPMVMEPNPSPRRALTMIHHPLGQPQQYSSGTCQIHARQSEIGSEKSQLRHTCESEVGSSGSLLLDARTLSVVGLHNQGGLDRKRGFNGGHKIGAVEAALSLGFVADSGPGIDPEVLAQDALNAALDVADLEAHRAALEDVIMQFPDTRVAGRAKILLNRLAPKPNPEADALAALAAAMQVANLTSRRTQLEAVISQYPNSSAAQSARNTLALMETPKPDPATEAQKLLVSAMAMDSKTARRAALAVVARKYAATEAGRSAKRILQRMDEADKPKPSEPKSSGIIQVKPNGAGDYKTISAAIAAAKTGSRIEVYPGTYTQNLRVSKSLEIVGVGNRRDIVIRVGAGNAILWTASAGLISNLTIRKTTGKQYAVSFKDGSAILENSDIQSLGLTSVAAQGASSNPIIRNNVIHDGESSGIMIYKNAKGIVERNELYGNKHAAIAVKEGANPIVRDNTIRDGKQAGIFVYDSGKGSFDRNLIEGNKTSGIAVSNNADPVFRDNTIRGGKASGIFVYDNGRGTFEGNQIVKNALSGFSVKTGGNPVVRNNVIRDGLQSGVFVFDKGRGTFENNEIIGNTYSGIAIKTGANPMIRKNIISDSKESGVYVFENGRGTLENNEIKRNSSVGVSIKDGGDPLVQNNTITKNGYQGVWIREGGKGRILDNDLRGNTHGAFLIKPDAGVITRRGNKE